MFPNGLDSIIKTASTNGPWAHIRERLLSVEYLRLRFGGFIFGGLIFYFILFYFIYLFFNILFFFGGGGLIIGILRYCKTVIQSQTNSSIRLQWVRKRTLATHM